MTVTTLVYTGAAQQYIVPAGCSYVTLDVSGAAGCGTTPSKGGRSVGKLVVSPGTVLWVYVGGTTSTSAGGWHGGGNGAAGTAWEGGGGGGASDVRLAGQAMSDRVIVAGGGGGRGGGSANYGGSGGGGGGATGATGSDGVGGGYGNSGGTQTSGNAPGSGGVATFGGSFGGGGGGGGYWGGRGATGSNVAGGGGGGGSGFLSNVLTGKLSYVGVRVGAGQVVITAVNSPPLAPTLTGPANNGSIISTGPNVFGWAFNDPDIGDAQTRADFRYKKAGDAVWTTITNAATTAPSYTLPGATWTVGFQYEWQVSTFDKLPAQSPWSSSRFTTTIASVPAPTITAPTPASDQFSTPVALAWTLPAGGFTQDAYRVQRGSAADGTGTVYYDSGQVTSTAQNALVPLDASMGRTDYLRVSFLYAGNWSAWASVAVVGQFAPPMVPLLVLGQVPGRPEVVVTITNPPGSAGFADTLVCDLHRTSPDGSKVRVAANLVPNSEFTDLMPGAGTTTYTAVAFAASGASTESY